VAQNNFPLLGFWWVVYGYSLSLDAAIMVSEKLPNYWWARHHFRDTTGCHGNSVTTLGCGFMGL